MVLMLFECIEFMTWSEIVYKQQLKTRNSTISTIYSFDGKQNGKKLHFLRTCNARSNDNTQTGKDAVLKPTSEQQ